MKSGDLTEVSLSYCRELKLFPLKNFFDKRYIQFFLQLVDTLKGGHLWLADKIFFPGRFLVKSLQKSLQKADIQLADTSI